MARYKVCGQRLRLMKLKHWEAERLERGHQLTFPSNDRRRTERMQGFPKSQILYSKKYVQKVGDFSIPWYSIFDIFDTRYPDELFTFSVDDGQSRMSFVNRWGNTSEENQSIPLFNPKILNQLRLLAPQQRFDIDSYRNTPSFLIFSLIAALW